MSTIVLGGKTYKVGVPYTIAGSFGNDYGLAYARLEDFKHENIDKNGFSINYPSYHFSFTLTKHANYDTGMAELYKLVIKRTVSNMISNGQSYSLNVPYTIAGSYGEHYGVAYARLEDFKNEYIDKHGFSIKHPRFHFDFKLTKRFEYDTGMADLYELVIKKI